MIYQGDLIEVWEGEGIVFLSFPACTVHIPEEHWHLVVAELEEMVAEVRKEEGRIFGEGN